MSRRSSGAIVSYVYSFGQIIVNLIYVPLLLGMIGQSEYGLYQMIGSIIAYLNIINSMLSAGAIRYYCRYAAEGDKDGMARVLGTLKRLYRIAGLIVIAATIVLAVALRIVYANSFTPWELDESCILLGILAASLLLTMNNTLSIAVITAHERFVFLKGTQLAVLLVQPVVVYALILNWPYAWVVSIAQLACNAACWAAQRYYAKSRLAMNERPHVFERELGRDLMRFSGGIVLAIIADQIFWKTDQLILGWMYGTAEVAVYAVAAQVVLAYMPLGTTVSSVFMPRISEVWHKDRDSQELSNIFVRVGRLSLYPMLLVLTGWIIFGPDFIGLWAGEAFYPAYWIALIILIPFTIDISQNIGLTILQVRDMYGFRGRAYLLAAILNIALTFVLAYYFRSIGAAVSSGIAMFLCSGIIMNWYFWKRVGLDVPRFWKRSLRMALPLCAVCAVSYVLWMYAPVPAGWLPLLVGILVYTVLFVIVAWFASCDEYERSLLSRMLGKLKVKTNQED